MKNNTITDLQNNEDYIILNNPLASPKFIRMIGKGKELAINDIYTPKIFYEIASKLTPEHLINIQRNQTVVMEIQIKDFLESIGANTKNYKHFIESVEVMQSNLLRWKEGDEIITTSIVSKSIHNPKTGKVEMYIDSDIAKRILEIKEDGNFSFLKSNVFRLQNAQAIKLYPFFKSWLNHGHYQTDLERFKVQFGYNTSGYKYWSNLEIKVLSPAVEEINEKTDIHVHYQPEGENLDGKRPKVRGVKFRIHKKNDIKLLPINSPTPGEPHLKPDTNQQGIFDKSNQIDELYNLIIKIQVTERPSEVSTKAFIENLIKDLGYQTVKDGLLGMVDSKAKPKSIAFFTRENILKHKGFEKAQIEIKKKRETQENIKKEQLRKERTIEELKKQYHDALDKFLQKTYQELDEKVKETQINEIWENSTVKFLHFRDSNIKNPTTYTIHEIAKKIAFPDGYDEQKQLKFFASKNYELQIDFDKDGKIILN